MTVWMNPFHPGLEERDDIASDHHALVLGHNSPFFYSLQWHLYADGQHRLATKGVALCWWTLQVEGQEPSAILAAFSSDASDPPM
jgi:hypothetical protein